MKLLLKIFLIFLFSQKLIAQETRTIKPSDFDTSKTLEVKGEIKANAAFSEMAAQDLNLKRNPFYNRNAGLAMFGKSFFRNNPDNVYQDSVSSVVIVDSWVKNKKTGKAEFVGTGAGVILKPVKGSHTLSEKGYEYFVLTNWHVIDGAQYVRLCFKPEGRTVTTDCKDTGGASAKLFNYSIEKDLALLTFVSKKKFKGIEFEDYDNIKVGEQVHAIGHPKNLLWSYSKGIISQIRDNYNYEIEGYKHFSTVIQMQTPISTGNSGGPLLNDSGKLVGINTWVNSSGQNLNFAISINSISAFFYQVVNQKLGKDFSYNVDKYKQDAANHIRKLFKCASKCVAVDDNKDGIADLYLIDENNNGKYEYYLLDANQDGYIEVMGIDLNENGSFEKVVYDNNNDRKPDFMHVDDNDDNNPDVTWYDSNGDGELDSWEPYKES